jgi:hypothetical protein
MPRIGQISLVSNTSAYCRVDWDKTKEHRGSCSFSVYIPTFPEKVGRLGSRKLSPRHAKLQRPLCSMLRLEHRTVKRRHIQWP